MKKVSFKIRRKIILAFLYCFLSVFMFAVVSFQVHHDIGRRLRLVEVADDLVNNILEIRRFEKNFFLYKQAGSLTEAMSYANRVEDLYVKNEQDILRLRQERESSSFLSALHRYKRTLSGIKSGADMGAEPQQPDMFAAEESLRTVGQELLDIASDWAKEERAKIDRLFRRALYLFVISMVLFGLFGVVVTLYISTRLTRPLIEMQTAMEKIAQGDFTPISVEGTHSEEFAPLFKAFNRMIHELEERQEQLVQARKISAIGTFTSGIAHELNNPVNNIVLTAEALREDFDELDREDALGMIDDITSQSERASEIIKNLLDFSRSERPELVSVSIADVIEDTLKLVRNQLLLSGVAEETEIADALPTVRGDYRSLQQVFLNLFVNAIQAMPQGGKLSVRAGISEDDRWVKIDVSDSGEGIDPTDIPRIFDPFFTTKEVGKGTGLGLSVTYGILQKHGGRIDVQTDRGEGTVFTILLPAEKTIGASE